MKKLLILPLLIFMFVSTVFAQVNDPIEQKLGFVPLFNGKNLDGWQGAIDQYEAKDGMLVCKAHGDLLTAGKYANFIFRFDFKLEPNGNNGVTFRANSVQGEHSFKNGTEIQILDDSGSEYTALADYQYHGSIYGVVPAKRGSLKPVGEWNSQEIICDGTRVKVTVNGMVIVDAKIDEITSFPDHRDHPALLNNNGFLGFLGHNCYVEFRNLRIKTLDQYGQGEKILKLEKELRDNP